jgi:hypothetical protein
MKHRTWFKMLWCTAAVAALTFAGCGQGVMEESELVGEAENAPGDGGSKGESGGGWFGLGEPDPEPRVATLDAGTPIRVRTTNTLSTKVVQTGEAFVGSLEEPIVQGDWVVAKKGSTVRGTVANSDPGGRVKGLAQLAIRISQIETTDGQTIDVQSSVYGVQAKQTKKKDAVKVGVGSAIGAVIGAVAGGGGGAAKGAAVGAGAGGGAVLATRGDPAVIPSETVATFTLQNPVSITEAL